MVSTCPSGLSMLGGDLARGLSPGMSQRIQPVIDAIRAEHPGVELATLPAHLRHAHAARIYAALDQPDKEVQLWLSASWLARDRGVGLFKGLDGPVIARMMLEAGEGELAKERPVDAQKKLVFNLAVVAARGGYPSRRNRLLETMRTLPLTPEEDRRVKKLEESIRIEAYYQDQALGALQRSLSRRAAKAVPIATYQLADLLRRRGRTEQALQAFRTVSSLEAAPQTIKDLAAYFTAELQGGTPWTESRFQKIAAPD